MQHYVSAPEKRKRGSQYQSGIDREVNNGNQNTSGPMFQQIYGESSFTPRNSTPEFQFAPPKHFRTVYHVPRGHNRTTTQQSLREFHDLVNPEASNYPQTQPNTPQHSPTHVDLMDEDESNIN